MMNASKSYHPPIELTQRLDVYEWLAVVTFLLSLLFLTLVVFDGRYSSRVALHATDKEVHFIKPQEIDIFVDGAVENPGKYRLKVGMRVKDALELAKPLEEADLGKVRPMSRLRNGQNVSVPVRQMITIFVTGAVQKEGPVTIPTKTPVSELGRYVQLTEEADLGKLARKRYLKKQEHFCVPKLKTRKL